MRCAKCGAENPDSQRFCGDCGAAILVATEAPNRLSVSSAPPSRPEAEAPDGERKIVTALFADLKGSTQLMEDLDPEEAHAIVEPALRIMAEAVRRYEGYVARSTGDGIFALFGAPAAYEDHPQRALYAALQIQHELRADGQRRAARGLRSLEARVGVHTGEVVAYTVETSGKVEYRLVGHTANLAARLESLAPAGSIAVSEYTRNLCEGYFELRGLGPMTVKGLSAPISVYEVIGLGALRSHFQLAARRGLTKFVGRARELEQMRCALELAMSGQGQIVAVMAEAGTGKSRLFHEFKATIPTTCKVLEAYSVSHGKASAWLPVLELLRGYFGIADADDASSRREKIRAALTALDPALDDTLPYLFGLLGIVQGPDPLAQMDPQIKRPRTLEAIKRIVFSESLKQPVVVIFEDLHWIDAQTQALLDLLADSVARSRVLLLFNYRPEYRHEWTNKSYYSQLRLDPLGGADGAAMLAALLGEAVELNPLKRLITERTGGNPFFIEEIVHALFDEGALVRNGAVKVTRSLSQLRLPPTVQGVLAARIDRQPVENKQLLQTLAVIGRESSLGLLRQIASHADTQLEQMLADLQAGEFIYEQTPGTDVEYLFKHALTQEVAYNSLLIERRKQIHERAGQALESIFANQLDDHLSQLAHHYSHSDNTDKAIEYLGRAGQQAVQRSANADAVASLIAAIDLLQKLPQSPPRHLRELPLRIALGQASIIIRGWEAQEVELAFTRAQEICAELGDPPEVFPILMGLWAMYLVRGLYRPAQERAHQLLLRAQRTSDPMELILAHYAMGTTLVHIGELSIAREHQAIVLSLYKPERDGPLAFSLGNDPRVGILAYAGWTLWFLGYPDRAVKVSKQAVAAAQGISHPNSLAFAESFFLLVRLLRREARMAQENAERAAAICTEHGLGGWIPVNLFHHGSAIVQQGQPTAGIAQMRNSLTLTNAAGMNIGRPYRLCTLAGVYKDIAFLDDALDAVGASLAASQEQGEFYYDAEAHRVSGDLLLMQGDSKATEAHGCYERAIAISRNQGAKSLELRATISLARLFAKQGRRTEAHAMLSEIYDWFTEGFDTADLKDAKALLDELAS
jgi:class 3 adenylate cyclase/predicted ATPase